MPEDLNKKSKHNYKMRLKFFFVFIFAIVNLWINKVEAVCEDCLIFQAEAPVPLLWTGGSVPLHVPDNLFVTLKFSDHFRGYVAGNKHTYTFQPDSNLLNLNQHTFNPSAIISPGALGSFDECGTWLQGAEIVDGANKVAGWYHAEMGNRCNGAVPSGDIHIKSIAYAESNDGGSSFSKLNYPNNQILTGHIDQLSDQEGSATRTVGVGDHSIVKKGEYYYLFFMNAYTARSGVARATVASGGKPGSWTKWYNGSFSQPGIGGRDSDLGILLAGVSYNTKINQFVGLTYEKPLEPDTDAGFKVAISEDGISWTILDAPLVPGGTRWAQSNMPSINGYSQYQTIIGPDGSKNWTDTFYVYYVYVRPGDYWTQRFMLRSEVKMKEYFSPISTPKASTSLYRYFSPSRGKHWVTSELAVPDETVWDFEREGNLGYVFNLEGAGMVKLNDCFFENPETGEDNYLVSVGESCATGSTTLRTIGWIYNPGLAQPNNTHAIYRCYNLTNRSHFVSTNQNCEGSQVEGLLGYVFNKIDFSPTVVPTGLNVL